MARSTQSLVFAYGSLGGIAVIPSPPISPTLQLPDSLGQSHDAMQNLSRRVHRTGLGGTYASMTRWEEERHWYGADNRLAFVERVALGAYDPLNPGAAARSGTFDEFRFDALGRRVLVRSRRDQLANQTNTVSTIDRVVWDGNAVLYELRSAGGPTDPWACPDFMDT